MSEPTEGESLSRSKNPWRRHGELLSLSEYRRRRQVRHLSVGLAAFGAVFACGLLLTAGRPLLVSGAQAAGGAVSGLFEGERFTCTVAKVTDGDTFRCQQRDVRGRAIRVRLSGVAARESDGSCSPGHPCPSASAEAATAELRGLALGWSLSCRKVGQTYGRVAAFCRRADGVDLSCAMVQSGTALKWQRYWGWHRCPPGSVPLQ